MEITKFYSQNYDKKKRTHKNITTIILHYTGMQSERESIKRLTSKRSKVSCHYLINRRGNIFKLVKEENVAWHAGKSMWGKYKNLNKNSIGIELVNRGHRFGYQTFPKIQIKKLVLLCKFLMKKYTIISKRSNKSEKKHKTFQKCVKTVQESYVRAEIQELNIILY